MLEEGPYQNLILSLPLKDSRGDENEGYGNKVNGNETDMEF